MSNLKVLIWFASAALICAYDAGLPHQYKYETTVVLSENCDDVADPVGHRLEADVHLTSVWQDPQDPSQRLMKIHIPEAKLRVLKKGSSFESKTDLQAAPKTDSFFLIQNNKVKAFFDEPSEHLALRNLKRSVASLLQMQTKNGDEKEVDVSGTCDVFYKVEGNRVRRVKNNCHHPLQDNVRPQASGVRSLDLRRSAGVDCELKAASSDVVSQCLAVEQVKSSSSLWKTSSICVQTTSQFSLTGVAEKTNVYKSKDYAEAVVEIKKKMGTLTEGTLMAVSKDRTQLSVGKVVDTTNNFKESIKPSNLAKLKSASAFFKLLPSFRSASKEDILKVLKDKKFDKIRPQILDILAAVSTPSAIDAVFTFYKDEKSYNEDLERYLISLSVIPRPEAFVLKEIKSFLERGKHNEKIEATLISTLGALLGTYSRNFGSGEKEVVDALDYLEGYLKHCKTDECMLTRLRGLRNAAQLRSVPLILQYALKGGKAALEAVLALRNIQSAQQVSKEVQDQLLKLFHQVGAKQDRSVRTVAAEILLRGQPEDAVLRTVLGSLSDQSDPEFSTFLVSKLKNLMSESEELRSRVRRVLSEGEIGHDYALSQGGKSSVFKNLLIETEDLNVTYGIEMELLQGGLMKRSSFDVAFERNGEAYNLLSVGMFAEGVGSLAGSESDEGVDPTAGMELTLLGSSIRPYVFFQGTSELMGHAWSGTASELTPALQGIFSLSDDNRHFVLHNGMDLRLELKGALSTDLSAAIQISLWSRNSQTQVKSAAALLVRGSAIVDAEVVQSRGEYIFYSQSSINFDTDLDFYDSPFKMCTQMEHPDVLVRHDFQKSFEVTGSKHSFKKNKKRKKFIPSRSYALHQKNSDFCRIMKSE